MGESYAYKCDRGHEIESSRPVSRCPVLRSGSPCPGALHATGEGAVAENARLKELRAAEPTNTTKETPMDEPTTAPTTDTPPAPTPEPSTLPGLTPVPLPRATSVAVEALELSLNRIPDRKSKVVDGVLHLDPAERDAVDQATRDHARELLAVNRAANSYRDVLLREIRKAIAGELGGAAPAKKKAPPAKKAAAKKKAAPAAKKPAAKKAPAKRSTPSKRSAKTADVEPRFKAQKKAS